MLGNHKSLSLYYIYFVREKNDLVHLPKPMTCPGKQEPRVSFLMHASLVIVQLKYVSLEQ